MSRKKSLTLKILLVALMAAVLLVACAPAGGEASEVEVFSWWTGGGEAAGLDAMIEVFKDKNPNIEFVNSAVAGGAGTNARAVLATRLSKMSPQIPGRGMPGRNWRHIRER